MPRSRYEAEFVDNQQLLSDELLLEPQKPPLVAGFHQFVDEGGGGGEADSEPLLASGQAEAQGDMRDGEYARILPLLPGQPRRGRKRRTDLRAVVDAIFYVLQSGCDWAKLPKGRCQSKPY
jgi:hypothetical protein